MRFYVYYEHIDSGKTNFVGIYNTKKEAVEKIRSCYNIDAKCSMKNEYYYFIKT